VLPQPVPALACELLRRSSMDDANVLTTLHRARGAGGSLVRCLHYTYSRRGLAHHALPVTAGLAADGDAPHTYLRRVLCSLALLCLRRQGSLLTNAVSHLLA